MKMAVLFRRLWACGTSDQWPFSQEAMGRLPAKWLHDSVWVIQESLANGEITELIWCKKLLFNAKCWSNQVFIFACTWAPVKRLSHEAPMRCHLWHWLAGNHLQRGGRSLHQPAWVPPQPVTSFLRARRCSQYMEPGWVRKLVFKGEFKLKTPLSSSGSPPSKFNTRYYFILFTNMECVLMGVKEIIDTEKIYQGFNSIHDIHLANIILFLYTSYLYFHIVRTLDETISLYQLPVLISWWKLIFKNLGLQILVISED